MTDKRKVIVNINGQDYTVIGEEPEDYIHQIAKYVEDKMTYLINKNERLSQTMAGVLTAFMIADEYHKIHHELMTTKDSERELASLKNQFETLQERHEQVKEERDNYRYDEGEIKRERQRLIKKNKQYEEALKLKEEELEKSQKMINQLQNKLFENQIELVQIKKEMDELMEDYDQS